MSTNTKTRPVAIHPDGRREVIHKTGSRTFTWVMGNRAWSHYQFMVDCLAADGIKVEREPNPRYKPQPELTYYNHLMAKIFTEGHYCKHCKEESTCT